MTSSSPLVTTPKVKIPRLDRDIIKRGGELFGPDGLDAKADEKTDGRYQGLPEFARPQIDTNSDKVRQPGTLLDPLNVLGLRQRTIDNLVEKGGQELIDSYDSSTGKYGSLSGWNRTLDGINDDDITKGILRRNEKLRNKDPEMQRDLDELERQGIEPDSLTTNRSIQDQAQNFRDVRTLETEIRQMEMGADALDTLIERNGGKPISKAELETLKTDLKPLQSDQIQLARSNDASIRNVDSQITNREGTLELANKQERNRNALSIAEIDYKNKATEYNYKTAQADRDLKKELALLGFEDKSAERKYDREERRDQNRQLLIMQMLKGLQNLGGSFSL